jgi:hypothetical protein
LASVSAGKGWSHSNFPSYNVCIKICAWTVIGKWYDLARDLQQAVLIEIPRYYFKEESITTGAKLHVFTDAIHSVYGSCAYIVTGNQLILVMAKNRVAPLKQITLPKLELMGAVVGARSLWLASVNTFSFAPVVIDSSLK